MHVSYQNSFFMMDIYYNVISIHQQESQFPQFHSFKYYYSLQRKCFIVCLLRSHLELMLTFDKLKENARPLIIFKILLYYKHKDQNK